MRTSIVTCLLVGACATNADRYQRAHVDEALELHIGQSIGPGDGTLPAGLTLGDGLGEDEAVALALWHNAAFQEALTELGLRRADLIQAGEIPNPTFWFLFPVGPKQIEYTARLPFDFLWQRPGRVAAAQFDCERVSALLVQGGLDLVRDVRSAYADLRLARARTRLAGARAALQRDIASFQAARLAAGDASDLEAATAEIDALRAAADRERAQQELALVDNRIRNLIGDRIARDVELADGSDAHVGPNGSRDLDELLAAAQALRPDLRAAEIAVEAAGERAGLARWQVLSVMGLADVNGNGPDFQLGPGFDMQVPLLNQNQGAKARARAELQQALRRQRAVRDRIDFEVREAHVRRLAADEVLHKQAAMLPLIEAVGRQAERAMRAGDQPILAVYQARLALLDVRLRNAEARAEGERADAQLARSIGGRLP